MMVKDRPNILWLVLDCARYDRISAHGHHRLTTPHLDRLIAEGLDYRHAYSASIWSLPAYTSLLTGLYPRQHGVNASGQALSGEVPTLASALAAAGYATACFSTNAWLEPTFGLHAGFQRFERMWFSAQPSLLGRAQFMADRLWGRLRGAEDKGARRTNRQVRRWWAEQEGPAFAFVAYIEPHTPYTNHSRLHHLFPDATTSPQGNHFDPYQWVEALPHTYEYPPEQLASLRFRYDLEMRYIDNAVGDLLAGLKGAGKFTNTLVIVTADHGELLGEGGMYGHQFSLAEPLRHVPLVIWSPDHFAQPARIEDLVQTLDLPATLCGWCGVPWPGAEAPQILPTQTGAGSRTYTITDYPIPHLEAVQRRYPHKDLSSLEAGLTCASDHRYKVVCRDEGDWWGYDLADDPAESNPLPVSAHPALLYLQERIESYRADVGGNPGGEQDIPAGVIAHLRALGYLD